MDPPSSERSRSCEAMADVSHQVPTTLPTRCFLRFVWLNVVVHDYASRVFGRFIFEERNPETSCT